MSARWKGVEKRVHRSTSRLFLNIRESTESSTFVLKYFRCAAGSWEAISLRSCHLSVTVAGGFISLRLRWRGTINSVALRGRSEIRRTLENFFVIDFVTYRSLSARPIIANSAFDIARISTHSRVSVKDSSRSLGRDHVGLFWEITFLRHRTERFEVQRHYWTRREVCRDDLKANQGQLSHFDQSVLNLCVKPKLDSFRKSALIRFADVHVTGCCNHVTTPSVVPVPKSQPDFLSKQVCDNRSQIRKLPK